DPALLKQALTVATDTGAFGACRLVIEAVPEMLDLKLETLTEIERQVPGDAVLASNTSSIPLTQLAEALERPSQFIGLHFFNPVPASKLIEVVVHDGVAAERSEEHTSELQSRENLVCRLMLVKKNLNSQH